MVESSLNISVTHFMQKNVVAFKRCKSYATCVINNNNKEENFDELLHGTDERIMDKFVEDLSI